MNCFVCSKYLNGDDHYVQSHLNHCLDRQGFSFDSREPLAQPSPASASNCTAPASFALPAPIPSLATDRELAHALLAQDSTDDSSGCPCCHAHWSDMNLSLPSTTLATLSTVDKVEQGRAKHVDKCLQQREAYNQHGEWEIDDKQDGPSGHTSSRALEPETPISTEHVGWTGAVGTKAEVRGTPSLLPLLRRALNKSHDSAHGRTVLAYLVSDHTQHVSTKLGDWGWGCGYKNLQMLFSSLRHLPQYRQHLARFVSLVSSSSNRSLVSPPSNRLEEIPIPTIPELQHLLEQAWAAGYDQEGARHFNYKLRGSKRWIGTTEAYTALTFLGIRARIVDFPKPKLKPVDSGVVRERSETHATLIKWLISYFSTPIPPDTSSRDSTSPEDAHEKLLSSPVRYVSRTKQPIYLQHQGHSRTIVGIEKSSQPTKRKLSTTTKTTRDGFNPGVGLEDEWWLLMFDPGEPISNEIKQLANGFDTDSQKQEEDPCRKKLKRNGFQDKLSRFDHSLRTETNPHEFKFGQVLKVFRVNMKNLKRRDEYQILLVEEDGDPLSEREQVERKFIKSEIGHA
ncbi:uncharacterized protein JCM15063_000101 [Sporobolomyces koalae]|uniref:uncharacterized protein n=1 Tax=Sporobolomyces koalae TaxID=500713 RepID=UPI003176D8CF